MKQTSVWHARPNGRAFALRGVWIARSLLAPPLRLCLHYATICENLRGPRAPRPHVTYLTHVTHLTLSAAALPRCALCGSLLAFGLLRSLVHKSSSPGRPAL